MGALIESKSFVCRLCHPIREMKNHGKPEVLRSVAGQDGDDHHAGNKSFP